MRLGHRAANDRCPSFRCKPLDMVRYYEKKEVDPELQPGFAPRREERPRPPCLQALLLCSPLIYSTPCLPATLLSGGWYISSLRGSHGPRIALRRPSGLRPHGTHTPKTLMPAYPLRAASWAASRRTSMATRRRSSRTSAWVAFRAPGWGHPRRREAVSTLGPQARPAPDGRQSGGSQPTALRRSTHRLLLAPSLPVDDSKVKPG